MCFARRAVLYEWLSDWGSKNYTFLLFPTFIYPSLFYPKLSLSILTLPVAHKCLQKMPVRPWKLSLLLELIWNWCDFDVTLTRVNRWLVKSVHLSFKTPKYAKNYEVRVSSRISYRRRRKPLLFKITLQNLDWRSDCQHFNNFENYLQIQCWQLSKILI